MKVTESKVDKKTSSSFLEVIFSSFQKNDLSFAKIVPYKRTTKEGYLVDRENEYQAYLRVKTGDLVSMNNTDLNRVISQLTSISRIYTEPFKILSMTYSTETTDQQRYWKSKITHYRRTLLSENISEKERNRYSMMQKLAMDNLRRATWVEDSLSELTFFIVVYGKSTKELETRIRDMVRLGGKQFDLKQIDRNNLEDIIFRLNNMNTEK